MVFGWFTKETKSFYLARPAEHAHDLIYLHPDKSIPRGTKITVRSDECALFFREGRYIGRLDAGTVQLDTANIPFLGHLLIDKFTGANHFLCEVFFVSLSETIFSVPATPLGQYQDRNSANVVSILGALSFTVRVSAPEKLVIELGGQSAGSSAVIADVLCGRILNQLRKAVAVRTQRLPVLDVVSNLDAEAISQEVKGLAHGEFDPLGIGLGRVYDLTLSLDDDSMALLRDFGRQESELRLQAKGAQLATSEGFAEFNLVQGQRAALEGLGKGLGTGNGPMIMTGMGLGANLTGPVERGAQRAPVGRGPTVISAPAAFFLRTDRGETGPFSARQIALTAISKGVDLSTMMIRGTEDAGDVAFPADAEPLIVAEYSRRKPASPAPSSASREAQALELAFSGAIRDGSLARSEFEMLVNLAVTLGLESGAAQAANRVTSMAQARGVRVED